MVGSCNAFVVTLWSVWGTVEMASDSLTRDGRAFSQATNIAMLMTAVRQFLRKS